MEHSAPTTPPVLLTPAPPTVRTSRTSSVGIGFVVLLLVVVTGVIIAFSVVVDSATNGDSDGIFGGKSEVQVLTADGIADLVAAIDEETGSTQVFRAVIYPTYASVSVPADGTSQREIGYSYDGHDLVATGSKSTSTSPRIDLARIDPAVVPPMVKAARSQVDDPTSWYVIINRDSFDAKGLISAYASNEFNEGGYILYDRLGREVRRTDW